MAGPWEEYQSSAKPWEAYAAPQIDTDPTKQGSNFLAGVGQGMASGIRALGGGRVLGAMGLPSTKEEADRLDAALRATTGGKIGGAVGFGALAAPTALIPGANTYAGAALIGAGTGAALTEGGVADRALGAVGGAAGGVVGKGLGDLIGKGAGMWSQSRADELARQQIANAQRDTAFSAAQKAGYVVPPADVKSSLTNEVLNGLSGKIKTAQVASSKNQGLTNSLVKKELGLAPDDPLTVQALSAVRQRAGQAYDAVEGLGTITPSKNYTDALDNIIAPYLRAQRSFPSAKPNPIVDEIKTLRTGAFDAADAVAKIKTLRADADAAYGGGNKDMGKALKSAADALEQAIDEHLAAAGPSQLLNNFRNARQLIAKTYTVQKGLNDATGDVSAQVLAKQLEKGKPLSGELRTIAEVAQAFPKATQALKETPKAVSPLDWALAAATGASTSNPLAVGLLAARPMARAAILSGPYQRGMMQNTYKPSLLMDRGLLAALESEPFARYAMPYGAVGGLLSLPTE